MILQARAHARCRVRLCHLNASCSCIAVNVEPIRRSMTTIKSLARLPILAVAAIMAAGGLPASAEAETSDRGGSKPVTQSKAVDQYWYGTFAAGALQPQNQSGYVETHYGYAITGTVQRNTGFSAEGGIGYSFGVVRAEVTYGYASNSLASSQASAKGINEKTKKLTGYTTTNTLIASAYWDIKIALASRHISAVALATD